MTCGRMLPAHFLDFNLKSEGRPSGRGDDECNLSNFFCRSRRRRDQPLAHRHLASAGLHVLPRSAQVPAIHPHGLAGGGPPWEPLGDAGRGGELAFRKADGRQPGQFQESRRPAELAKAAEALAKERSAFALPIPRWETQLHPP